MLVIIFDREGQVKTLPLPFKEVKPIATESVPWRFAAACASPGVFVAKCTLQAHFLPK